MRRGATEAAWDIANDAMQILGGIGYGDISPVERMVRDYRLVQIWTGTNEIMNLMIQHEYYHEVLAPTSSLRDVELGAATGGASAEKVFGDEALPGMPAG